MSKKNIIALIIVIVVVVGLLLGWYFFKDDLFSRSDDSTSTNADEVVRPPADTVWILDGNFNPSVTIISPGDTVTWVNKDAIQRQVAADPHPTSTSYPELVSEVLEEGDSYTFTFPEAGEWYYHDYLNPIQKGKIVVE